MFRSFAPIYPERLQQSLELARQALDAMPALESGRVGAFVSGSLFAGLGTPHSDIDLFVVPEDESGFVTQVPLGDDRVDVEAVSLRSLAQTLDDGLRLAPDREAMRVTLSRRGVDTLVRFSLGEIISDDGRLEKLQTRVRESADEIIRLLLLLHTQGVQNAVEDAQGFLAAGALRPAELQARRALLLASEAFLTHRGDVYLGNKWIWHRWRRSVGDEFGADLADLVVTGGQIASTTDDVFRLLWLAQSLALAAVAPIECAPVLDCPPGSYRRDPFAAAMPATDAIMIYRSRRSALRVSRQGAYLWAVSHGRSRSEAVAVSTEQLARAGFPVTQEAVDSYFDSLVRWGLLVSDTVPVYGEPSG